MLDRNSGLSVTPPIVPGRRIRRLRARADPAMGTNGMGRTFPDSVAQQVVRASHVPVTPARERGPRDDSGEHAAAQVLVHHCD